jgi:hypothetical protein
VILLVTFLLLLALGVAVLLVELHRAPLVRATTWSRRQRVVVAGALGALMMVALSPSMALIEERPLPTARPPEPWREPGTGCSDDNGDHTLILLAAVGIYLALRGGPAIGGMVVARVRRDDVPRRQPSGRIALRVTTIAFAVVGGLVVARLAAGGAPVEHFTTYGAITPAGARGWRVDAALALALGARSAVPEGAIIADELESHGGSHGGFIAGPYTSARAGLQAWVGDRPVLFHLDDAKVVVGSWVHRRDPEQIPHQRRPHFAAWPQVARLDRDHLVVVGRAADGGTLAVKVNDYDLGATAATCADAGLLVRPPLLPAIIALFVGGGGLLLGRLGRRRDAAGLRLLAAWFLLEATAVLLYGYLAAFGLTPA